MKENREKRDHVREQLFNAIEREKATVVGRDIPFEVDPNAGYDVTSCKIADLASTIQLDQEAAPGAIGESNLILTFL